MCPLIRSVWQGGCFQLALIKNNFLNLLIFEWEEGRKEREREKHWFAVAHIYAFIGWFLCVPWPGSATSSFWDNVPTSRATWPGPIHRLSFYLSMDLVFSSVSIFLIFKRSFVFSECSYLFKKIASWRLTIFWGSFSDLFVFKIFVCLYCRLLWSSLFLCFWALSHVGTFPQTLRNPFILCSYFC